MPTPVWSAISGYLKNVPILIAIIVKVDRNGQGRQNDHHHPVIVDRFCPGPRGLGVVFVRNEGVKERL